MLTINEKKVLRYVLVNLYSDTSINQVAKDTALSPNGAYKILRKLEKMGILTAKKVINASSFSPNWENPQCRTVFSLALYDEPRGKVKYRAQDLKPLQATTRAAIIFGSYLRKKNPGDLDVFFVIEKRNFQKYKNTLKVVAEAVPLPIHDVIQTPEDLVRNLRGGNPILKEVIWNGFFLWGQEELVEVLANV